jgi:hypothetical protein
MELLKSMNIGLLGCDAVESIRWIPISRKNLLLTPSGYIVLKMVATLTFETLVFVYENARRHFPEYLNLVLQYGCHILFVRATNPTQPTLYCPVI